MQAAAESSRDETMARLSAEAKTRRGGDPRGFDRGGRRASAAAPTTTSPPSANGRRPRSPGSARRPRPASPPARRPSMARWRPTPHVVEARVQQVAATVADYQAEMAEFFQRLLAEEDPTRIATMAETMPDPPDLADIAASIAEPQVEPFDPGAARLALIPDAAAPEAGEAAPEGGDAAPDFAAAEAEALAYTGDAEVDGAGGCRVCRRRPRPTDRSTSRTCRPRPSPRPRPRTRRASTPAPLPPATKGPSGRPPPSRGACRRRAASSERVVTRVVVARPRQRREHRHLQARPGPAAGVIGDRGRLRSGRRVRLHASPTRRGSRCPMRSPRCRASTPASPGEPDGGIDVTAHDPDGD